MLRWGIISTGTIAKKFAQTLTALKGEVVFGGVASRDLEKAQSFATEYGALKAFGSYEEMAASQDIDAIYIATPNKFHFENTMLCLENGKHVLCEKPFTTNANDARKLYAFAKSKNLLVMDGLWTMHIPMYKKIKELIAEGAIGELVHVRAEYGFSPTGARKDFKMDPTLGGGSLLDVGIYNVGFVAMLLGVMPLAVYAHLGFGAYDTDQLATALLAYPGGVTASVTSSIGAKMPQEGVIFGTEGRIILPNYQSCTQGTLQPTEGEPTHYELPFDVNGFEYQVREFGKTVAAGLVESSQLTEDFSVGVLQILDNIRKAGGLTYDFEG